MKREISHWKKAESSKNQQLILKLLNEIGPMRFNELYAKINKTSKISQPTLSKHLKQLEKDKIERYWNKNKSGDCYRIKPENREKVKAEIQKHEAIKFIEGISNPVHHFEPGKKIDIAAFTSVLATINRAECQTEVKKTVKKMAKLFSFIPSLKTDQKMAVVIMVRGKEGVES
jgi:DNA-binding MarR family transcriptional regulator